MQILSLEHSSASWHGCWLSEFLSLKLSCCCANNQIYAGQPCQGIPAWYQSIPVSHKHRHWPHVLAEDYLRCLSSFKHSWTISEQHWTRAHGQIKDLSVKNLLGTCEVYVGVHLKRGWKHLWWSGKYCGGTWQPEGCGRVWWEGGQIRKFEIQFINDVFCLLC